MIDKKILDIEAIKARHQAAFDWAKATGYEARDYYDTMSEIEILLALIAKLEAELIDARNYATEIAQGVTHYPHTEDEPCIRCGKDKLHSALMRLAEPKAEFNFCPVCQVQKRNGSHDSSLAECWLWESFCAQEGK